jgi:hypothetical protein
MRRALAAQLRDYLGQCHHTGRESPGQQHTNGARCSERGPARCLLWLRCQMGERCYDDWRESLRPVHGLGGLRRTVLFASTRTRQQNEPYRCPGTPILPQLAPVRNLAAPPSCGAAQRHLCWGKNNAIIRTRHSQTRGYYQLRVISRMPGTHRLHTRHKEHHMAARQVLWTWRAFVVSGAGGNGLLQGRRLGRAGGRS